MRNFTQCLDMSGPSYLALPCDNYKLYRYHVIPFGSLWLFDIAMEHGQFINDFPIKTFIYSGFSMAMLDNHVVSLFERGVHDVKLFQARQSSARRLQTVIVDAAAT